MKNIFFFSQAHKIRILFFLASTGKVVLTELYSLCSCSSYNKKKEKYFLFQVRDALLQLGLSWYKNLITSWCSYTFKCASNFKHRVVLNDFRKTTLCLKLDAYLNVYCHYVLPPQLSWLKKKILTPFHCCGEWTNSQKTLIASMVCLTGVSSQWSYWTQILLDYRNYCIRWCEEYFCLTICKMGIQMLSPFFEMSWTLQI